MKKMSYTASKYNKFININAEKIMAFNSFGNICEIIDRDMKFAYDKIINGEDISDEKLQTLLKKGFIVPLNFNELDQIKRGFYLTKFQEKKKRKLIIIPTLDCDFTCSYCMQTDVDKTESSRIDIMSEEIEEYTVSYIKKSLVPDTRLHVLWYGGEPSLAIDRIHSLSKKIIEIANEKKVNYGSFMVTNGYHLTKVNIKKLVESKIDSFQVTIDGPKEIHDKRKKYCNSNSNYETLLSGIENISDEPAVKKVILRINVDNLNKNHVLDFLTDLKDRNFQLRKKVKINLAPVVTEVAPNFYAKHCLSPKDFSEIQIPFYRKALELGFQIGVVKPVRIFNSCTAVNSNSLTILPNGELHKCVETVDSKELSIGKLTKQGIQFNPQEMNKWSSLPSFRESCQNCSVLPLCMGGCHLKLLRKNKNYPSTVCTPYKYNLTEMLQLHACSLDTFQPSVS